MLLMPNIGSERLALVRVTPQWSQEVRSVSPDQRRRTSLSSSGPVAVLLCVCMCVCTHALEIDTPMGPEAPEQASTAPGLWSLE